MSTQEATIKNESEDKMLYIERGNNYPMIGPNSSETLTLDKNTTYGYHHAQEPRHSHEFTTTSWNKAKYDIPDN